ncbi:hypothetical protein VC835_22165 [Citrobacter portucalensis]|uniref:DUF6884 domain-containing protein n=1 Tax=Citrobacter portucalensis TaxID=1639133 RepID=UPI002B229C9D|nr:DUF6884 domain-containing protein [Citrobacter portucalensis]MEB0790474.1 hypothetical protein [Citrobacter portucalensis]
MTAGELYTGQHWCRAVAAAARNGAEMWVISAGLGLLHASDPVVPYEATFSSMPFCHRTHWERLTTRPLSERHCCKVSDEAAFCLIQRPYISKTLLTRRISPRGSP